MGKTKKVVASQIIEHESGEKVEVVPLPVDPLKTKDRFTANLIMHHQHIGDSPISAEIRFSEMLGTFDVEPINKRRLKVTDEWQSLDFDGIDEDLIGTIVIQNNAGLNLNVTPTDEEIALYDSQIVRVWLSEKVSLVVPPRQFRGPISLEVDFSKLKIKCDNGSCRCYLWAFPK